MDASANVPVDTEDASDELAHAALSWDIAGWIAQRLTVAQQGSIDAHRRQAIADLMAEVSSPMPEHLRIALGLPSVDEARAILDAMQTELWSAAA